MLFIVDTNVASELMRSAPSERVSTWVRGKRGTDLCTSAITIGEIRYGIERLPDGRRKDTLRSAADHIFAVFTDQILPFDAAAAEQYGVIVSRREALGTPIDGFDAQIAAICTVHGAVLATRNVRDFADTGVEVFDPWQAAV